MVTEKALMRAADVSDGDVWDHVDLIKVFVCPPYVIHYKPPHIPYVVIPPQDSTLTIFLF
jgi:hypothetical protein